VTLLKTWITVIGSAGLALVLSGCFESRQEKFNKAVSLYIRDTANQEAIREARDIFQELSKDGDSKSQYMLALMYIRGDGVVLDMDKALDLLLKSSANGNGDASLYASRFYLEDKFGQKRDESLARQLLFKSSRDGSDLGRFVLATYYLNGGIGLSKDVDAALVELQGVHAGPYRPYAAQPLLSIYSNANSPYYSPEKAVREMEILAQTGSPSLKAALASAYAGTILGRKVEGIKDEAKFSAYFQRLEQENDLAAIAITTTLAHDADYFKTRKQDSIKLMIDAIRASKLDPMLATMFCDTMAGNYTGITREPRFELMDIIKACAVGAESNNSYHQYILAAAYYRMGDYNQSYKWAMIAGMNGNQSGVQLASQVAIAHLDAKRATLTKEAEEKFNALKGAQKPQFLPPHQMPWYEATPS